MSSAGELHYGNITIIDSNVEPLQRSSAQRECEPVRAADGIRGGAARGLHHGRATLRHHLRQQRVGEAVRLEERGGNRKNMRLSLTMKAWS